MDIFLKTTSALNDETRVKLLNFINIKHDTSKGFALGLVSHGIGTARAIEISEKAAAFSALAMGLSGIFTAVFLPMIITFFK